MSERLGSSQQDPVGRILMSWMMVSMLDPGSTISLTRLALCRLRSAKIITTVAKSRKIAESWA